MRRTHLHRALLLAGLLAAAGLARAEMTGMHNETWFFPDGTSYSMTVPDDATMVASDDVTMTLHTNEMGAGPASMDADESSNVTQTWFFPDGTQQTITWMTPSGSEDFSVAVLPEALP